MSPLVVLMVNKPDSRLILLGVGSRPRSAPNQPPDKRTTSTLLALLEDFVFVGLGASSLRGCFSGPAANNSMARVARSGSSFLKVAAIDARSLLLLALRSAESCISKAVYSSRRFVARTWSATIQAEDPVGLADRN